jgi:HAMP domain-containing protein
MEKAAFGRLFCFWGVSCSTFCGHHWPLLLSGLSILVVGFCGHIGHGGVSRKGLFDGQESDEKAMPTPAVTLKLRRFRRRFGIAAPKVVVRSHVPWRWFVLPALLLALLLGAIGWLVARRDEAGALAGEVDGLRQKIQEQREELNMLRLTAGTGKNAVSIERASQQQLLGKIQSLEAENAALKEDILLFERLIPVAGEGSSVRIETFRVALEAPGRIRYRLLLAFQPDKQNPEFRGRLELAINFAHAGKKMQLLLPEKREGLSAYQIEMKHFLRREGVFELPEGAMLQDVEVRVLQGDTLKSKRLAQL